MDEQLDCTQCAWKTDREACRVCKQGRGGSWKDISAMIQEKKEVEDEYERQNRNMQSSPRKLRCL